MICIHITNSISTIWNFNSSHQYLHFKCNTTNFILVFFLFLFVTFFCYIEKLGSHYSNIFYFIGFLCIQSLSDMLRYPICIPSSLTCMCAQLLSDFWLCDPTDCSPPGSSVYGILWTICRILQATCQEYWIGLPFPIPGHSQWALICCAKSSLSLVLF